VAANWLRVEPRKHREELDVNAVMPLKIFRTARVPDNKMCPKF